MFIIKRAKCFFKKIGRQRQREDMRNQLFIHLNSATIKIISGCFKTNKKTNNNKQKFINTVKTNMKASEIIDCTCTVASISSISRFACANVRSVLVATSGIYVAFAIVGVCFAFVNICQKKEKKRK